MALRRSLSATRAPLAALAALVACVLPALGQETERAARDSVVAGTPADSAAQADSAAADGRIGPLRTPLAGRLRPRDGAGAEPDSDPGSGPVVEWGRERVLASGAVSFLDLLAEMVPGVTTLRAGWFGGPHHLLLGTLGPGFVSVEIDGRELIPLQAGQPDLTRISLAWVDRVRVHREVDGLRVEVWTTRRRAATAYSRIDAGTGDPDASLIRGVYDNGLGREFDAATGFELLNVAGGERPSDRFDFWGRVGWTPPDGSAGVELHFRTESVEREVAAAEELTRRSVYLRAAGRVAGGWDVAAFAGASELQRFEETALRVRQAGLRIEGTGGRARGGLALRVRDDPALEAVAGELEAAWDPLPRLRLSGAARGAIWDDFETAAGRLAAQWDPAWPLEPRIRLEGGSGARGVPYPAATRATKLSYDVLAATGELGLGPLRLSERWEYQRLGAQPPFGASFDSAAAAGPAAELSVFETALSGPVLPVGMLIPGLAPIRVRGAWRYATSPSGPLPRMVPANQVRGELFLHDSFFTGNLELRLGLGVDRRDAFTMPAPTPEEPAAVATIPAYTFFDFDLMVRILEVRIWWRFENLRNEPAQDVPGVLFPSRRQVFGVKWEFLN